MKDISPYDSHAPKERYTIRQKNIAKYLYQVEGYGMTEIAEKTCVPRELLYKWRKKFGWVPGKYQELGELSDLQERLKKAEHLGLGVVDQMMKASEIMQATTKQEMMSMGKDKDGNPTMVPVTVQEPDYKMQNEGLKRAMELTGTKVERKEIEHKGRQEVVHKYELPAKKPL